MLPAHPSYNKLCIEPGRQRGASRKQTTTRETGGFVLPGRMKQKKHEGADVFFCDPVQSTGISKQILLKPLSSNVEGLFQFA